MTTDKEQASITKYDLYYASRMTRMETVSDELKDTIKELKSDLRLHRLLLLLGVFGITLGFYAITLSMMAHEFKWF